ncbi:MAG: hypothetical protein RB191_09260 [Terriglobia bacterium]|nr:hypothetical protein [Terriglobia bacterium]
MSITSSQEWEGTLSAIGVAEIVNDHWQLALRHVPPDTPSSDG